MMRISRWRIGVLVVIASLVTAGCSSSANVPATKGKDGLTKITWMSARGSIDVMDDYPLWVAIDRGYFAKLGLSVQLVPGPTDATASTKFVAQGEADASLPSPGVLASSIDQGVKVISIYNLIGGQLFNFAVKKGSDIKTIADLKGKSISVASPAWQLIIAPMLVEAGVDPGSVKYINAGAQWGQAVVTGKADAALGWDGMRAQWAGQGLDVDWVIGRKTSKQPSNGFDVAVAQLKDEGRRDEWTRFLKGVNMGQEFARANPRAAAQITYDHVPNLAATLAPKLAFESLLELQQAYSLSKDAGKGWGWHDPAAWNSYLGTVAKLGQTSKVLDANVVYTNELLKAASDIDVNRVQSDAKGFTLDAKFSKLEAPK